MLVSDLDKHNYPWNIWYIWKACKDKLFLGIKRDPLELIRHVDSEFWAWFDANSKTSDETRPAHKIKNIQVLSLNICLVDGSWTYEA